MTPTLHIVRHAQGFHNLDAISHILPDPQLTELGKRQCEELHNAFPNISSIDLIVASPIKRTIWTALLTFHSVIKSKKLTIMAIPELQEVSDMPCDTGSSVEELEKEFAGQPVDFLLVTPDWTTKKGEWAPWTAPCKARALKARRWLRNREERNIAVVTHGGFISYLTEAHEGWDAYDLENLERKLTSTTNLTAEERINIWLKEHPSSGWRNCGYRAYAFDTTKEETASLVETEESRQRQGTTKSQTDSKAV